MRPAKKEYSDLPTAQKHTYLLENVITFCAALTTTLIWIAWVIFAVSQNPRLMDNDATLGLMLASGTFFIISGLYFGYAIKVSKGWYTDLDLEAAERKVLKIKEALD